MAGIYLGAGLGVADVNTRELVYLPSEFKSLSSFLNHRICSLLIRSNHYKAVGIFRKHISLYSAVDGVYSDDTYIADNIIKSWMSLFIRDASFTNSSVAVQQLRVRWCFLQILNHYEWLGNQFILFANALQYAIDDGYVLLAIPFTHLLYGIILY